MPPVYSVVIQGCVFGRWISTHQGVRTLNNTPQLQQHLPSDEIDLFELFHAIWKQKKLVIGCTILAGLLGVGYAVFAPRVYQVSSVLRPAAINELDALNRSEVYKLPPANALAKVGAYFRCISFAV